MDQFNNPMIIGGANLSASISTDSNLDYTWVDNGNGTYSVTYNTTVATTQVTIISNYKLTIIQGSLNIALNGSPIKGSPFKVIVGPGPIYAPNCYAFQNNTQKGLTSGVAGVTNYFSIQLKDYYNNSILIDPKQPINVTMVSSAGNFKVIFLENFM
jgi:hypothetical protein